MAGLKGALHSPGPGLHAGSLGERVDVLRIKDRLVDALAENGPLYWDCLRKFVTGKYSRQEFDTCAGRFLNKEIVALHNSLVVATIRNALGLKPPPSSEAATGWGRSRKRERDAEQGDVQVKRKRRSMQLRKCAAGLGKAERDRLKEIISMQRDAFVTPFQPRRIISLPGAPPTPIPSTYAKDYAIGLHTPRCLESRQLPDLRTMRQRMHQIALHEGLVGGIGEQAEEFMTYALETHLKNVITACVNKVRARALYAPGDAGHIDVPAPSDPSCGEASGAAPPASNPPAGGPRAPASRNSTKTLLTMDDLAFAVDLTPNILVEMPLGRERWFLSDDTGDGEGEQGS